MSQTFLTPKQVCERYQISMMALWRWEHKEDLAFPKPMVVNRRKFYREADLNSWERGRVKVSA